MADDFRTERDSMGEMRFPASALYGAQTARAVETTLTDLGRTAEVHVGAPIDAGTFSMDRRDALVGEVRERIRELAAL